MGSDRRVCSGLLAGLMVAAFAAPAVGQVGSEAEVRGVEMARFAAQMQRDTTALHGLLGDDLVYVHSNALVESKDHFIETIAIGRIVYDSVVPREMRHRVFGETAVGNGIVHVQVQIEGRTVAVDLLFTTVHVRRGGRWQLVAWQSTRAP